MRKVVLVSTLIVLLACGSSADVLSPGGGSSGPPCTLTVSGATAGSYACTTRSASSSDTTGLGYLMIVLTLTFLAGRLEKRLEVAEA